MLDSNNVLKEIEQELNLHSEEDISLADKISQFNQSQQLLTQQLENQIEALKKELKDTESAVMEAKSSSYATALLNCHKEGWKKQ